MARYRYVILFVICMVLFPNISKAECSYERQAELSRIASNVQLSYSYEMENGYPRFTVNISNVSDDIYLKDLGLDEIIAIDGERNFTYSTDGVSFQYGIYSSDSNCYGEYILTKYLTLPKYNYFSNTEVCKMNPDFKYCGLWDNVSLNSEQFSEAFKQYQNVNKQKNAVEGKTNFYDFLLQHKNMIISCLCAAFILLIVLFVRKSKR